MPRCAQVCPGRGRRKRSAWGRAGGISLPGDGQPGQLERHHQHSGLADPADPFLIDRVTRSRPLGRWEAMKLQGFPIKTALLPNRPTDLMSSLSSSPRPVWTSHCVRGQRQPAQPPHAHTWLRLHPVLERRATRTLHEGRTGLKSTGTQRGVGSRRKGSGQKDSPVPEKSGGLLRGGGGGADLEGKVQCSVQSSCLLSMGVGPGRVPSPRACQRCSPASVNSSVKQGLTACGTGVL